MEFILGWLVPFANAEVYQHEMPGGQYSNLQQQAKIVGLGDRWTDIKKVYHQVNMMFGDIIKVTPSSKVVGDMTLYMVQNNLTEKDIYEKGDTLDFPQSVVEFFSFINASVVRTNTTEVMRHFFHVVNIHLWLTFCTCQCIVHGVHTRLACTICKCRSIPT